MELNSILLSHRELYVYSWTLGIWSLTKWLEQCIHPTSRLTISRISCLLQRWNTGSLETCTHSAALSCLLEFSLKVVDTLNSAHSISCCSWDNTGSTESHETASLAYQILVVGKQYMIGGEKTWLSGEKGKDISIWLLGKDASRFHLNLNSILLQVCRNPAPRQAVPLTGCRPWICGWEELLGS